MKAFTLKVGKYHALSLVLSAALLPCSVYSQSLEQAVAYTLDTNPELRVAYTRFKVNEKKVEQAEAGYLPTIDLTGGIGYEYTDSPGTRRDGNDNTEELMRRELGISLKQNIFSGFHTQSEVERTSYATSAEQWRLHSKAEDLALQVSKVYVDLIKDNALVALSEKYLVSHEEIHEMIKLRTESGFSSSADLSQINGRLAKAHSIVIAAKNNALDSKTSFYRLIGQKPENLVIPMPDASKLPKTQAQGLQLALDNHPTIRAAGNDIHSAKAQYESSKSSYYPNVSLELNANFNDDLDGEDGTGARDVGGENNEFQAMLRFSYNLYSGGKDKAYSKETAYKKSEAYELNRNVQRQVKEGFILSWDAFEQLNLQKKYIKMHVISAKDTQSDYAEQFKIGQRSLLDLLDTQNELYQSRRDFLEAEFSEITAQYRILNAMGLLVDTLKVTRPKSWQGEEQFAGGVEL
ncbi:TolC family type I secretion outer membrane protein [Psychromonas sp. CNPT3]|uniref:TolC family outer membrane protein n=1 Tax=Psychromonas sp. CNPT3 TaxID=314282 RepID=UPI0002C05D23|nr:TolC family outer membrane protein [Psychromonas sp. CNPT3]AGH80836.1 TolC family type I secretion outer membrane protein [Psychromonas sp. CNPT3]